MYLVIVGHVNIKNEFFFLRSKHRYSFMIFRSEKHIAIINFLLSMTETKQRLLFKAIAIFWFTNIFIVF